MPGPEPRVERARSAAMNGWGDILLMNARRPPCRGTGGRFAARWCLVIAADADSALHPRMEGADVVVEARCVAHLDRSLCREP